METDLTGSCFLLETGLERQGRGTRATLESCPLLVEKI